MIFDAAQGRFNAPLRLGAGNTLLIKNSELDVYPLAAGGDPNTADDYLSSDDLSAITTCQGNSSFNPLNRVSSSVIPVSGCMNNEQWTSLYSGTP